MRAPNYRWICYRCQATNEPGTNECLSCSFTANPTGAQLDAARKDPSQRTSQKHGEQEGVASTFFLFFPEGILAAGVLLSSPVLLFKLIAEGKVVAALLFLLAVGVGGALLYFADRERSRGLAYIAVLALVAAGYVFASA